MAKFVHSLFVHFNNNKTAAEFVVESGVDSGVDSVVVVSVASVCVRVLVGGG